MELISCIRFSLQLLAAEGAMVWGLPGRKNFGLRLAAGLAGYFAFALLIFFGLRSLPETKLAGSAGRFQKRSFCLPAWWHMPPSIWQFP